MNNKTKKLIRFDWAMKKLLRDKANFDILEGFLSELLKEQITIRQILDSESNKETKDDKHNRVDILVENSKNELVIIEIQNSQEYDYFHRILFGTAKALIEHIKKGAPFADVKKVISITIAYFDLGQGKDYVYHGTTSFKGIHKGDILDLSDKQKEKYTKDAVHEIFPEYWIIKVSKFKDRINDKLDEWIYFLKNSEVKANFTAKGLPEAIEKLTEIKLTDKERIIYEQYLKELRNIASEQHTKMIDAEDLINKGLKKGIEKGIKQREEELIIDMHNEGISIERISKISKLSLQIVETIIENHKNKK